MTVPPLGLNVVDSDTHVMCLTRNLTTRALKVIGLPTLLPQNAGEHVTYLAVFFPAVSGDLPSVL